MSMCSLLQRRASLLCEHMGGGWWERVGAGSGREKEGERARVNKAKALGTDDVIIES